MSLLFERCDVLSIDWSMDHLHRGIVWTSCAFAGVFATMTMSMLGFYAYVRSSETRLQRFSLIPLGISRQRWRRKKRRPHYVTDMRKFPTFEAWSRSLKRTKRNTLTKKQPQAFARLNIKRVSRPSSCLGFRHFWTIVSHERVTCRGERNIFAIFMSSVLRFFVASCMSGVIDEYYVTRKTDDGSGKRMMIAWSQTLVYGNTLRAMWFYQKKVQVSKNYIWFAAIRIAVLRCFAMKKDGVNFVDLGPSNSDSSAKTKCAYGFNLSRSWNVDCYRRTVAEAQAAKRPPDLIGALLQEGASPPSKQQTKATKARRRCR